MRTVRFVLPLVTLGALAACANPAGPNGPLVGNWISLPLVPSGAYTSLALAGTPRAITGSAGEFGIAGRPLRALTVRGAEPDFTNFSLELVASGQVFATYVGRFADPNTITGTWTESGQAPFTATFARQ